MTPHPGHLPQGDREFVSAFFRVPRTVLARLAAEEYVRQFWWFIGVVPLFGIIALIWGSGLLQIIGAFGLLWPLTIPTRAVIASWKAGRFFSSGVQLETDDDWLYFTPVDGKGMKLRATSVRRVSERHGFLVLHFGIGHFVAIPIAALGDAQSRLLAMVASAGNHGSRESGIKGTGDQEFTG